MEWREIGQSADMSRRRVAGVPDASTHAFTLQRQADAYRSSIANTFRCGLSVPDSPDAVEHGQPDAYSSRMVRALGKIGSVNTA